MSTPARARRAVIAGCARDCGPHLDAVLANLDRIAASCAQWRAVIIENDSKDQTKAVLASWARGRPEAVIVGMDGLAAEPARTRRLERARNTYVELIRSDAALRDFDYLVVMDMDEINAAEIPAEAIERAFEFLEADPTRAGVFANQAGPYYDMWALRHPERCPGDVWEEVCDYALGRGASDEEAFQATFGRRMFTLEPDAQPLEVDSAFGGLGIYRLQSVLRNPNPYLGYKVKILSSGGRRQIARWQCCEHVHFHRGLRQLGGRLHVLPWLINADTRGLRFPASAYRSMLF